MLALAQVCVCAKQLWGGGVHAGERSVSAAWSGSVHGPARGHGLGGDDLWTRLNMVKAALLFYLKRRQPYRVAPLGPGSSQDPGKHQSDTVHLLRIPEPGKITLVDSSFQNPPGSMDSCHAGNCITQWFLTLG